VAAPDERPWAKGVSAADQKAALELYDQGNKFFEESEYKEALEKYEEALKHWPHPAVYFNAAVCLHHLDQDVKAADYIDKATAYKDAPFDKKTWAQVGDYQTLLASLVTELEVKCTQDDAKITLDTELILPSCPATATRKLAVKQDHVILGEKPGYETAKIGPIRLAPGEKKRIEVVLKPAGKGHLVRRWNRLVPWAIAGVGTVVGWAGALDMYYGKMHVDSYNDRVGRDCLAGCQLDPSIAGLLPAGQTQFSHGRVIAIAGGIVAAAGFTMVLLNTPHLEHAPQVAPSIGPDHAGAVVFGSW